MTELLQTILVNAVSVFVGLYLLWTFMGILSPGQRAWSAAISAAFAALATLVVYSIVGIAKGSLLFDKE